PIRAEDLYEQTDLSEFNAALPERFATYTAFLERNDLTHRWQEGRDGSRFDERLAAATFPDAVHTLAAGDLSEIASRLDWLRHAMVIDMTRHPRRFEYPFNVPEYQGAGSRHARIQDQRGARLAAQQQLVEQMDIRLRRLERTTLSGLLILGLRKLRDLFRR